MLLLLAVACASDRRDGPSPSKHSDPYHTGVDTAGGDTSGPDSAKSSDTHTTNEEEFCALEIAPAQTWAGAPTCTEVDFRGWDFEAEREFTNDILYSAPFAAPLSDGLTHVIVASAWDDVSMFDMQAGTETILEGVQVDSNGIAIGRPQGGSPAIMAMASHDVDRVFIQIFEETGNVLGASEAVSYTWAPSIVDLNFDGSPEFVSDGVALDRDASVLAATAPGGYSHYVSAVRSDADDEVSVVGGAGVWHVGQGILSDWTGLPTPTPGYHQHPHASVFAIGNERVISGISGYSVFVSDMDGEVEWALGTADADDWPSEDTIMAFGDVNGDGNPEICAGAQGSLQVVDLGDRRVLWSAPHNEYYSATGGCAMADLDADGRYEVVDWGEHGLFLRDGSTGEVLASREDIATAAFNVAPIIADVDDDGSAEIVVAGGYPAEGDWPHQSWLWVFGPASGRWARTRPVWNQMAYDVTSIRDDGIINSFPFANWDTYNSFRAQPAHDGEHPDLVIAGTDACADVCAEGGTIRLAVQVSNPGSVDAFAGSIVRLYTWTEATGLRVVAETALEETVPAGESAEGVVLELPYTDWGDRQVLEVVGTHDDECDWVNNREEVYIPDPCAEAR
ncbi:MAG: FG-GAP repeat domain-containing protein [Myxococcota bacterium]